MAENIRVDSLQLNECASKYSGAMDTLGDAVDKLEAAVDALAIDWTGEASSIMAGTVRVIAGKIRRSIERCDDAIKELKAVSDITEETENKEKNRMSGLETISRDAPFVG